MKISELKDSMNNVDVSAEIVEMPEPRTVLTKFGNNRVCSAKIKDDSGTATLSLWGKQIDLFAVGDTVEITNGYTKSFRDEIQINVGKTGSIRKL